MNAAMCMRRIALCVIQVNTAVDRLVFKVQPVVPGCLVQRPVIGGKCKVLKTGAVPADTARIDLTTVSLHSSTEMISRVPRWYTH